MKLLKQFPSPRATYTSLKRGVNERATITEAPLVWRQPRVEDILANQTSGESCRAALINTRFQPGVSKHMSAETVLTVSWSRN